MPPVPEDCKDMLEVADGCLELHPEKRLTNKKIYNVLNKGECDTRISDEQHILIKDKTREVSRTFYEKNKKITIVCISAFPKTPKY